MFYDPVSFCHRLSLLSSYSICNCLNTTKSIHYNKISYCLQYTHESSYIQQKNTRKRGGTLYDDVAVAYQTLRRVAFAHIVETDETAPSVIQFTRFYVDKGFFCDRIKIIF